MKYSWVLPAPIISTWLPLLKETLAQWGLHVVTEADKAVLDASAKFPTDVLQGATPKPAMALSNVSWEWTQAELKRRGIET